MTIYIGTEGNDAHVAPDSHMFGLGGDDILWITDSGEGPGGFLYGGDGADALKGSFGDDAIYGGLDDDTLSGVFGRDVLHGGKGDDTFSFTFANVPGSVGPVVVGGVDYILDFKPGKDTIAAASMGFPDPDMLYRKNTGFVAIDFDGDGGSMKPVRFVKIDKYLDLKDGDLIVV